MVHGIRPNGKVHGFWLLHHSRTKMCFTRWKGVVRGTWRHDWWDLVDVTVRGIWWTKSSNMTIPLWGGDHGRAIDAASQDNVGGF